MLLSWTGRSDLKPALRRTLFPKFRAGPMAIEMQTVILADAAALHFSGGQNGWDSPLRHSLLRADWNSSSSKEGSRAKAVRPDNCVSPHGDTPRAPKRVHAGGNPRIVFRFRSAHSSSGPMAEIIRTKARGTRSLDREN